MKIRASITLTDEQVAGIMEKANLNTYQEVAAFLKGMYLSEYPQYAEFLEVEALEESEDTE